MKEENKVTDRENEATEMEQIWVRAYVTGKKIYGRHVKNVT